MKIAYICQTYPPMISGVSHALERLATGMAQRGHEVLVVVASDRGDAYTRKTPGLRVVRLRSFPNPLAENQRFMFWQRGNIINALKSFSPDIVHLHDALLAGIPGLLGGSRALWPVVLTVHVLPQVLHSHAPAVPGLAKILDLGSGIYASLLLERCAKVIAPSQLAARKISQLAACYPRVISNGINLDLFSPTAADKDERARLRRKYGLDAGRPVILHVGRISKEKSVDVVVSAAAQAMQASDAQLLVVGDGPQRREIMALCAALGIAGRSHFPGFVSAQGDLPGLYRLAAVFVMASAVETQGLVALEAAASAVPVVAVAGTVSAIPEVVVHAVNGFTVPPGDAARLGEQMLRVLADQDLARAMGCAGRQIAAAHSIKDTLDKHEVVYQEICASKPMAFCGRKDTSKLLACAGGHEWRQPND
ncbi:MAG: glycosyltransferase [Anaerolineae bacterium]|nr:glycosyltransferase [Anaerolineae bacterium]